MITWATPADYLAWAELDAAPPGLARAVRAANRAVRAATLTARYDTGADRLPLDPEVTAAFREAVCAHTAYLLDIGDLTGAAANTDLTVGSVKVKRGDTTDLAAAAYRILHEAGLAGDQPHIIG
ncbi:hypothetical protein LO763_22870 [Glycomyces sp. A-F 0318]|uniref:hypothetical protein n=1 Tax=Glycomyces amatae TaxID=2881355 RepID=UPI001E51C4B3|nr:hypothetical protein [Glycomyces amatae]MCD0446463.1 hypothetical protein [Glycomyces amatae]